MTAGWVANIMCVGFILAAYRDSALTAAVFSDTNSTPGLCVRDIHENACEYIYVWRNVVCSADSTLRYKKTMHNLQQT